MRRIAIKLEYDGTDFAGWQLQSGERTVQGVAEEALSKATGALDRIPVLGASRTDAGVHAEGHAAARNRYAGGAGGACGREGR